MFYELLNEEEANDIKEVSKETGNDYGLQNRFLPINSWRKIAKDRKILQEALEEELEDTKKYYEEKIKKMEEEMEENYRPIPIAEQYGISDRDFI